MKELRELIQSKLEEIQDLETTSLIPDELMEENKVYFTYSLQKFFEDSDHNKNYTYQIVLTGYIKTKDSSEENILELIDIKGDEILDKLKELNIKCDLLDVTDTDSSYKKLKVIGSVRYNEINYTLI